MLVCVSYDGLLFSFATYCCVQNLHVVTGFFYFYKGVVISSPSILAGLFLAIETFLIAKLGLGVGFFWCGVGLVFLGGGGVWFGLGFLHLMKNS